MIKIKRTEVHIEDNDLFYLLNQFEFDGYYYITCMYQPFKLTS